MSTKPVPGSSGARPTPPLWPAGLWLGWAGAMAVLRVLLATLASAAAAEALELHVSAHPTAPAGDGTRLRPFATLHEARDAMRAGLGANEPRTVRVEGDHHLAQPLLLDERDSGTATAPVTWASLVSRPILSLIPHPALTPRPGARTQRRQLASRAG
eukprot:COSAG04_NODE_642_length_11667_cov_3.319502_9_plen_157_part_00